MKQIACENNGATWQIAAGGNLEDAMADYYTFLAPMLALFPPKRGPPAPLLGVVKCLSRTIPSAAVLPALHALHPVALVQQLREPEPRHPRRGRAAC